MRLKTVSQTPYKPFLKINITRKHFHYSKEYYENKYFHDFCTLEPFNQNIKHTSKYTITARIPKLL